MVHQDSINENFENDGKRRHKKVVPHPVILNWSIAFLAKNSGGTYKGVVKIMLLYNISYIYQKSREMVSRSPGKGYSIHIDTIANLVKWVNDTEMNDHQRTRCIVKTPLISALVWNMIM